MKNSCPFHKCGKQCEYDGSAVIGIQIEGAWRAIHRSCFTLYAMTQAFKNIAEGRRSWDNGSR